MDLCRGGSGEGPTMLSQRTWKLEEVFLFAKRRCYYTPGCSHKRAAGPWAPRQVPTMGLTGRKATTRVDLAWPWSFPVVNPKLTSLVKGSQPGWSETRKQFCKLSLAPERWKSGPKKNLDSRKINILWKTENVSLSWFKLPTAHIIRGSAWKRAGSWEKRIDAFELWCWRRLLRVLWTARRPNQQS